MPTLIELNNLKDNIELCKQLNLDLLEINMNLPMYQLENLHKLPKSNDIEFSLHLPEELNVWDFNNYIKSAYINTVLETISIAQNKDISILNMHMNKGVYFTLPEEKVYLFKKNIENYLDSTKNFASIISNELNGTNIKIHIENTGIYDQDYITQAIGIFMEYDCFELTWDIGHDFSSGNLDLHIIDQYIDKTTHIHLHDYIGKSNHLELGSGKLDLIEFYNKIKRVSKSIILETKTVKGLIKSVEYFNENIQID